MDKIDQIVGLYRSVDSDKSIVVSIKHYSFGPIMFELFLIRCKDLVGSVGAQKVVHHVGLDRKVGGQCSGQICQRLGEENGSETRVKILSIWDQSHSHNGQLNYKVNVLEYRHPYFSHDEINPTANRHLLFTSKYNICEEAVGDGALIVLYLSVMNHKDGSVKYFKYYKYDNEVREFCSSKLPARFEFGEPSWAERNPNLAVKTVKCYKMIAGETDKLLSGDEDIFSEIEC